jgi:GNAT superfamily N-acetyltransferase
VKATATHGMQTTRRSDTLPARLRGVAKRILRAPRQWYRRLFQSQNLIYRFDRNHAGLKANPDVHVETIDNAAEVSVEVQAELAQAPGAGSVAMTMDELHHAATLWLARVDGRIAGFMLTRRGADFRRWYVDLAPEDLVAYRALTLPAYRGRAVWPTLLAHVIAAARKMNSNVFADTKVYNRPAQRALEKAGFRVIGKQKQMSREEALGCPQ